MHRLFFSTNNILYPGALPLFSIITQHSKHYKDYHYQTQHYQNQPYQLNPTALTMSAPSNPAVCFICSKEPSIDHPVILITNAVGCERTFGVYCLTRWQDNAKACCIRTIITYGWTKDPRVDPDLTKYGGLLNNPFTPLPLPTPAGKKPSWLGRYSRKCLRPLYSYLIEVRTTINDDKMPLGAYLPRRLRHIPLPSWDGVAPLVAIPSQPECLRCRKYEEKLKALREKLRMERLEKKEKKEMKKKAKKEMKEMKKMQKKK
jgi:hypothetical protein